MSPKPAAQPRSVSKDPVSRLVLERVWYLHSRLQSGSYPNCSSAARELEVSRKTIQRDIDFMRDRFSLPIEFDSVRCGYFYTETVKSIPGLQVTEGELVALLIAQKALAQHKGTAFEAPLRSACAKMTALLGDHISIDLAELENSISFKETGATAVDPGVFETLGQAVTQSRELRFFYTKLGAQESEQRRVQPYHLGCVNNQWYVFAFDLERQGMRTFAVPRLKNPVLLEAGFERPAQFNIQDYLGNSLDVFRGDGVLRVIRVRFSAWAAQLVRERAWHPSQKITELDSGRIEVEMELSTLEEVERWVLGFGRHACVVSPPELVERVRATIAQMGSLYGDNSH